MDPLTGAVSQLIGLTCSSMLMGWLVLYAGEWIMRAMVAAMDDWIDLDD